MQNAMKTALTGFDQIRGPAGVRRIVTTRMHKNFFENAKQTDFKKCEKNLEKMKPKNAIFFWNFLIFLEKNWRPVAKKASENFEYLTKSSENLGQENLDRAESIYINSDSNNARECV